MRLGSHASPLLASVVAAPLAEARCVPKLFTEAANRPKLPSPLPVGPDVLAFSISACVALPVASQPRPAMAFDAFTVEPVTASAAITPQVKSLPAWVALKVS